MTVGDICIRSVVTAHPDETVVEAAKRMRDRHVGDLLVADAQARPTGILTDCDIVVSAVAQSPDRLESLLVGDVMTRDLVTARAGDSLDEALKTMRARGYDGSRSCPRTGDSRVSSHSMTSSKSCPRNSGSSSGWWRASRSASASCAGDNSLHRRAANVKKRILDLSPHCPGAPATNHPVFRRSFSRVVACASTWEGAEDASMRCQVITPVS